MIDPQTLEQLEAIDERSWGVIYKQLLLYSTFKLNKAGFEIRTEKDSVDAEHFVADAIEKLFDGTRKWDFKRFPDVGIHLKLIIKSLISNHFKASKRSVVNAGGDYDKTNNMPDNSDDSLNDELLSDDIRTTESPEEILINEEDWKKIEVAFGESKDEHAIFSEWLEGNPPRTIAESLEIPVSDVNNAIKKGKRIVKTLFSKQS
jgi:DNA-directed RNA polymerase specialized sigma24 family protein